MVSRVRLGKRTHQVKRYKKGEYVRGRWVEGEAEEIEIVANIQPSMTWKMTHLLPEGMREKQMIAIYSNHWLHGSLSGDHTGNNDGRTPDVILYRGAEWVVVLALPYGNFGEHVEAIAVRVDKATYIEEEGLMGVVN